ncbi:adenylate/guanylate cyclase domain-containing protein [Verrucomicrobium spinosum]|uniref:adenylate/guanylate cyclase domain-containing protein n=1 Tax=Verrucomicrobium spinosum TaxID=2736 RepID=UPI0009461DC8|nr:adenylate/guanylate cyclase domain-containing protein [Verrucomicrobium spinosum]
MTVAPTGTITFLFSDIEGSTKKWDQHPDAMQVALGKHDRMLREIFAACSGYVFKTIGDAFCVAFDTAQWAWRRRWSASGRCGMPTGGRWGDCACAWPCTLGLPSTGMGTTSARR